MVKNSIAGTIILSFIFIFSCLFFFNFENLYFLENKIFPFDSIVYKDLALSFFAENYKDTVDYTSTLIYYPHTTKIIYPLLSGLINSNFNLDLINTMFYLNLISIYLSFIIGFFLINKFINNILFSLLIIFLFLIIWNAPLRATFYNPAGGFAFDAFLISIYTYTIFFLNDKKKINFIFIILLLTILSFQRYVISVFLVVIPIILNHLETINIKKSKIGNLLKVKLSFEDKLKLLVLFVVFLIVSLNSEPSGTYSRIKFIIKFFYFHSNPFEFLYTYYYAYGSFFLIFISCLLIKNFRNLLILEYYKINRQKRITFLSVLITSIIASTIGGDDSDRMLMWFFIWHLVLFSISLKYIFKFKYKFLIIIFILTHFFGSRIITQGIPNYTISDTFLYYSQQTTTNFKDEYFKGPLFLKKFRNRLQEYKLNTIPGIYIDNKSKIISTYLPVGKIKNDNTINIYNHPYKYRINDIPFPFGYVHNQRNAHIDHPWHGKWWVRFFYLSQWFFIQIIIFLYLSFKRSKSV